MKFYSVVVPVFAGFTDRAAKECAVEPPAQSLVQLRATVVKSAAPLPLEMHTDEASKAVEEVVKAVEHKTAAELALLEAATTWPAHPHAALLDFTARLRNLRARADPAGFMVPIVLGIAGVTIVVGIAALYSVHKAESRQGDQGLLYEEPRSARPPPPQSTRADSVYAGRGPSTDSSSKQVPRAERTETAASEKSRGRSPRIAGNQPRDLANGSLTVPEVPYGQGTFHQLSWGSWEKGPGDSLVLHLLDLHDRVTSTARGRLTSTSKMELVDPQGRRWANVLSLKGQPRVHHAFHFMDNQNRLYAQMKRTDAGADLLDATGKKIYAVVGDFENPELLKGNGVIQVVHADGRVAAQCEVDARVGNPRCYSIVKANEDLGLIISTLVALSDVDDLWRRGAVAGGAEAHDRQSQRTYEDGMSITGFSQGKRGSGLLEAGSALFD
mmetsp:Transcript_11781/g.26021  ORF Transcript_11781/g.26021 Transcript_11781/m.26021 type:complete len:441 (+) Transcript_11781:108-1430(+)|eukprot:CAMPEP_0204269374 /NCGR_PEP_ID=MMETSP0468-20130131/15953_1 /ASSEMBLY_ACC=CAM_ASM_000383 /TAXON_ID=2969 /ORGANISM="Oxyrrhis marina" /LENGTH=440 /DNA_ID=CAMNT_0051244751 /DNA_START=73 /DNA_END=1395 /DNA_ORIENTATION=+